MRKWRERRLAKLPEYFREQLLRKKYGLSLSELNGLLVAQQFKCAICETPLDEITRHVDHDHATGHIRGLLCHNCNVTLGLCKDSPDILRKAASYLERKKEPLQKVGKHGN